jgi:stage II sporulation protein D
MKRLSVFFTVILLSIYILPATAGSAVTADGLVLGGEIRVGLTARYSNLGSVTLSNTTLDVGFQGTGGFAFEVRFHGPSGFVAAADSSYYFSVGLFTTYAEAESRASSLRHQGYRTVPALTGINRWTVYVGGYHSAAAAQSDMNALGGTSAPANGRRIILTERNVNVAVFDSPTLFPQFSAVGINERVSLGQNSYRGRIELTRIGGQNITAVNVIGVEEYLYSVVPSEMPHRWHAEALKAQAVACRTYAVTRRGVHSESGFDVCDSVHCQAYHGAGQETPETTAAVNATMHMLLWHNNEPINATYFASSGGFTDHSENVWVNTVPYMRSVMDPHEIEPRVWSRVITLSDLDRSLAARQASIGRATGMRIDRVQNNRVQELTVTGIFGNITLTKEEIRTFFAPAGGSLDSRNFTIEGGSHNPTALTSPVNVLGAGATSGSQVISAHYIRSHDGGVLPAAASGSVITVRSAYGHASYSINPQGQVPEGSFVLNGLGHGHGVGMSQAGARGMAENGFTFEQILRHYYTGTEIRRWR